MAPTESTPLRGVPYDTARQQRKRRVAVLVGIIAVAAVALGYWLIRDTVPSHSKSDPTEAKTPAKSSGTSPAGADLSDILCGITKQETGYVTLKNKKDDHYFYWFHESRRDPESDPLVIWLTGGPGCSSMMAMLTENGPCHINSDLTTEFNPYSWNSEANVIWLDQPSNVGFSYGPSVDADKNEDDVGDNIYWFLHGFLDDHPDFEGRDLYITGESYAGHYVPAAAHKIWRENKNVKAENATIRINLKGIAIGNGLTNPTVQMLHSLDMADNSYNITLMNATELEHAKEILPGCLDMFKKLIAEGKLTANMTDPSMVDEKILDCQLAMAPFAKSGRNPYDIRQSCPMDVQDPTQCYDIKFVRDYLNSPVVREALNISSESRQWLECNASVGLEFMLSGDVLENYESYVADLLNDGDIRVLLYVGDADTMCNWSGNKAWATALEWEHKDEFNDAKERPFLTSNGTVNAGVLKAYEHQFTFLRLFNSGHMVPMDQPIVALEMINKFLANEDF